MYQQVNAGREGIGTGPFRLVSFTPGQGTEYVAYGNYRKKGLPYLNQLSLPTMPDEQARIAALRAGAIDGATLSADGARSFQGNSNFVVLRGLTAAFRELQMTQKLGEDKPWHDKRVRQAVNFAINRQEILNRVYNGFGEYSGHVPPGYGPWPLTRAELRNKYLKFDLAKARTLMRQAGFANGFEVTMSTFSTPLDFGQVAAVIKAQLDRIGIEVNIKAEEPGTFAANNGAGRFEWDLTGARHARRRRWLHGRVQPGERQLQGVVPGVQERQDVASRRQRVHHARREEAPRDVQGAAEDPARRSSCRCRSWR